MKYVGIDWAKEVHRAVLLSEEGQVLGRWPVDSDRNGVEVLLDHLREAGGPSEVLIALEPGAALLIERLLQDGYRLWTLNPKQLDRFREALRVSGAKDDDSDAEVAARALRMDHERMPELKREDERTEELLLRSRARLRLVQERVAVRNRLTAALGNYFTAALDLGREADDPFFLEFLRRWPDPEAARGASLAKLRTLVEKHRLRALTPEKAYETLRAPALYARPSAVAAHRDEVLGLVERIQTLNEQIAQSEERLEALFESHPDRDLLLSLPGMGETLAIRVGTGFGASRIQALDSRSLQAYAGTAPVTHSTGSRRREGKIVPGTRSVVMRRACNRQLQADLHLWARQSLRRSRWAKATYAAALARGIGRHAALRIVAHKWVRILSAVLKTRTAYDETRYLQSLAAHGVPWAKNLTQVA